MEPPNLGALMLTIELGSLRSIIDIYLSILPERAERKGLKQDSEFLT